MIRRMMIPPAARHDHEPTSEPQRGGSLGQRRTRWAAPGLAGAALLVGALSGCLFEGGDAAGTNDETTTSLQILADNVQEVPKMTASHAGVAARTARTASAVDEEIRWLPGDFIDHGTWSEWKMYGGAARRPVAGFPHRFEFRYVGHTNTRRGFIEFVEEGVQDSSNPSAWNGCNEITMRVTTRTGFVWSIGPLGDICDPIHLGSYQGAVPERRIEFPSLGLHVDIKSDLSDEIDGLREPRYRPVLTAEGKVVGLVKFVYKTTSDGGVHLDSFLWYTVFGVPVRPRSLPFLANAQDSTGLRILSLRRDSADGSLVIRGRFYIPEEYGATAESLFVESSTDSIFRPNHFPAWGMGVRSFGFGPPERYFTLRVPRGDSTLVDAGWLQVSVIVASRGRGVIHTLRGTTLRLPVWRSANPQASGRGEDRPRAFHLGKSARNDLLHLRQAIASPLDSKADR